VASREAPRGFTHLSRAGSRSAAPRLGPFAGRQQQPERHAAYGGAAPGPIQDTGQTLAAPPGTVRPRDPPPTAQADAGARDFAVSNEAQGLHLFMCCIEDMLGHASIMLTADTYTSVLPEVARHAAEAVATLVLQAGRLVPGTSRPRRRQPGRPKPRRTATINRAAAMSGQSRAHPARQLGHPPRQPARPAAA
jgi:hypothetical protein